MAAEYEIRASYDRDSIVIYQAYSASIAKPAIEGQSFVAPFSFQRMTWIKPSFLWLMHRSNWAQKKGQEYVLAVHIRRDCWDTALAEGVLTHHEPGIYPNASEWRQAFISSRIHIQWDTERTLRGAAMNCFSIQVGVSRHLIREYVDNWVVQIEDLTDRVDKMRRLIRGGQANKAKKLLPEERIYPIDRAAAKRIMAR